MKPIATIMLILALPGSYLHAQYIMAGIHGAGDHYNQFTPFKSVYAISGTIDDSDTLYIDINGDGIQDFQLNTICDAFGHWHHLEHSFIQPLNGNQVCILPFDSCLEVSGSDTIWHPIAMAKPFSLNDTIHQNHIWIDSAAYLYTGGFDCCLPSGGSYACNLTSFPSQPAYIGTKINTSGGPYYGWIQIKHLEYDSMVVADFATNSFSIGVETYQPDYDFMVSPNPASTETQLQFNSLLDNSILTVYNVSGQLILQIPHISGPTNTLNCSNLPAGVYYIEINQPNRSYFHTSKFIVLR